MPRRSLVSRAFGRRRFAKRARKSIRTWRRKKEIKKTRRTVSSAPREPSLPDRKVVSLKWTESRIMKHNGYAGYDRSTLIDINDSSMRGVSKVFDAGTSLFNGQVGMGTPVAVTGVACEKYSRDAADGDDVTDEYKDALQYVGCNFLDTKYPYGRPMNEWQMRCNNPMNPDPHGTIGKTYWSCVDMGSFRSSAPPNGLLKQYSIIPRPVVHRPFMMDQFRLHWDKFCVLAVTFDIAWQALPYDTKSTNAAYARRMVLKNDHTAMPAGSTTDFWEAVPLGQAGDTYDLMNSRAASGSFLKNVELVATRQLTMSMHRIPPSRVTNNSSFTNTQDTSDPPQTVSNAATWGTSETFVHPSHSFPVMNDPKDLVFDTDFPFVTKDWTPSAPSGAAAVAHYVDSVQYYPSGGTASAMYEAPHLRLISGAYEETFENLAQWMTANPHWDAFAYGGELNSWIAEWFHSVTHTDQHGSYTPGDQNFHNEKASINFYQTQFDYDPTNEVTLEMRRDKTKYPLPEDGSRIVWAPSCQPMDGSSSTEPLDLQVNDVIRFQCTRIGDTDKTRESLSVTGSYLDMLSANGKEFPPLVGATSTSGNVKYVYAFVSKVLRGRFWMDDTHDHNTHVTVSERLAYELTSLHVNQLSRPVDLRPWVCCFNIAPGMAPINYRVYRPSFLSEDAAGGNPAQSDAFKGPGYLAFRITNETKINDPEFQACNWDVARIRETQPKSVQIKTVGYNDRRVHKTSLSWSLRTQKKFRPKGFTKRRRLLEEHHHDVILDSAGLQHSSTTGWASSDPNFQDPPGQVNPGYNANSVAPITGTTDATQGDAGLTGDAFNVNAHDPARFHQHLTARTGKTSVPHKDVPEDPRNTVDKISDLYSGRNPHGAPLVEGTTANYTEYYNPAVGQCDMMANRDFPLEERPRFYMQYMRAHTDDPFDSKQELLQPPPIRVKVTARYRVAFMKSSEKRKDMAYGGLPDSMDYDGASDPHIRQNPCGPFKTAVESDGSGVSVTKAVRAQTVAGQLGDGFSSTGLKLSPSQIERNAAHYDLATLTSDAAEAGIRIKSYNRGDLICETDSGIMLVPSIRKQSGKFHDTFIYDKFDGFYKHAVLQLENKVASNQATERERESIRSLNLLASADRATSGQPQEDLERAFLTLDEHVGQMVKKVRENAGPDNIQVPFRNYETTDPATDSTVFIDGQSVLPRWDTRKQPNVDHYSSHGGVYDNIPGNDLGLDAETSAALADHVSSAYNSLVSYLGGHKKVHEFAAKNAPLAMNLFGMNGLLSPGQLMSVQAANQIWGNTAVMLDANADNATLT